jgi:hypothetical protein
MNYPTRVLDVECYPNFFLVLLKDTKTGELLRFQISPNRTMNALGLIQAMATSTTVGFNSLSYDLPMIQLSLREGISTQELSEASGDIIRGMKTREFYDKWRPTNHNWNHIDIINVAPGQASLKLYAGRLHCKKMQDLPVNPNVEITAEEAAVITLYCENDIDNTLTLFKELWPQIKLRQKLGKMYRKDLRSKSDPQVAEAIICTEVAKINGCFPQRPTSVEKRFKYSIPSWLEYKTDVLRKVKDMLVDLVFEVGDNGAVKTPPALEGLAVRVGGGTYRLGIGGLHSSETRICYTVDDDTLLLDRDVASYYPSIILTQGLYPKHIGPAFLTVYKGIVTTRLEAKHSGDKETAESLKVAVNGTFGKLGSMYSPIYSPDLMIQITITGQVALLMLIEALEQAGIDVVSANTDGIVIMCRKIQQDKMLEIVAWWEKTTGFVTEETAYSSYYAKDVNNYIAIKPDGKIKTKGLYSNPWNPDSGVPAVFKLQKNPSTTIVIEAVIALLRDGVPLYYTVSHCRDIRKFVSVRKVAGGATQNKQYLGKIVRWYYATDKNVINYKKSGYRVPKSDSSKALMDLPDTFPPDVNFDWYVQEAEDALNNIGWTQGRLF